MIHSIINYVNQRMTAVTTAFAVCLAAQSADIAAAQTGGDQIAFTSERDGSSEIYVMNSDGSGQTRLTKNTTYDLQPTFSKDGSKIAFVSFRDGNMEIYVMKADGSGQTRLTNHQEYDLDPSFSADGKRIAYTSCRGGSP